MNMCRSIVMVLVVSTATLVGCAPGGSGGSRSGQGPEASSGVSPLAPANPRAAGDRIDRDEIAQSADAPTVDGLAPGLPSGADPAAVPPGAPMFGGAQSAGGGAEVGAGDGPRSGVAPAAGGAAAVAPLFGGGSGSETGSAQSLAPSPARATELQQRGHGLPPGSGDESGRSRYHRYMPPAAPGNENYASVAEDGFTAVAAQPLSTFSSDVDTASYANVRRFLRDGQLPPADAVRLEEFVNYFDYDYAEPRGGDPIAVHADVMAAPWAPGNRLVRIGLRARSFPGHDRPRANLVFLIDVSGSMADERKLPLLQNAFRQLVGELRPDDTVGIVTYAGWSGVAIEPTPVRDAGAILAVIDRLAAGGSTHAAAGIQDAYALAAEAYVAGGANRVILATDGDFNVGVTDPDDLVAMIERHAEGNIFLSVLGFGVGNLKDSTMEHLANRGNGNYSYIDTANEARKVLVNEASATLMTVAKDVKIQVEFNPEHVEAYRLLGYENRMLANRDFEDDAKDAGDVGAGHMVTVLYELVLPGADQTGQSRYRFEPRPLGNFADELMLVSVRYKQPEGDSSRLIERVVDVESSGDADMRFAASVAAFGMILGQSPHRGSANLEMVRQLALEGQGDDRFGYRTEFLGLVDAVDRLGVSEGYPAPRRGSRYGQGAPGLAP